MPTISNREHAVDYDRLYELILLAKGDGRSLRQYAKDACVSHSVFNKIKRKEFKPGLQTLLHLVCGNARPENNVSIFELMDAAGLPSVNFTKMLEDMTSVVHE